MSYTGLRDIIAKMQEKLYDEYYPGWLEETAGLKAALAEKPAEWKNEYLGQWTKLKKEPRDKDHRVDALCYGYVFKPFTISKKEMNMAYDQNIKYDGIDCATGPSSTAIEREKITINKSEYDALREQLTQWNTMARMHGVADMNIRRTEGWVTVAEMFKRHKNDLDYKQTQSERAQEITAEVRSEVNNLRNELQAAKTELLTLKSKKRKRTK